jgi:uncharacterized protein YvpB
MKKLFLEITYIILFSFLSLYFYFNINNLKEENTELYNYFNNQELLDSSGNINLSEIIYKKNTLYTQLKELTNFNDINEEDINNKIKEMKEQSTKEAEEIKQLSTTLDELNDKIDSLKMQYNTLNTKYNQLLNAKKQNTSKTYLINNFPTINQYPNYPTGCESVAITLLLQYYGIKVTPDDIISNLKKGDTPYSMNGILYGGNPELEFVGNPLSSSGYGVFESPIADVANIYKSGINIKNNFPFSEVLNLVKNNKPVVVWTSMNLAIPYISATWTYKPTMETISWKANEHAVVVIGYNSNNVIISDPIGGKIKYQNITTFESRYNYYGKKALYY